MNIDEIANKIWATAYNPNAPRYVVVGIRTMYNRVFYRMLRKSDSRKRGRRVGFYAYEWKRKRDLAFKRAHHELR